MDLLAIERLLSALNEYQRKVAEIGPGACAVWGAPGSGKTNALVSRIARMARDGLPPQFCLAMTFTRAAAAELNSRLSAIGISAKITTIHALALDMLQIDAPELLAGLTLDESGYRLSMELKKAVTSLRIEKKISNNLTVDMSGLQRFVTFMKSSGPSWTFGNPFGLNDAYESTLKRIAPAFYEDSGGLEPEELELILKTYEQRRAAAALYDFDDMQLFAWSLLVSSKPVLKRWREMYSAIMVDEAMDSSAIQWDIALMLSGRRSSFRATESLTDGSETPGNLMVLGDVCQSCYAWRSAVPEWFVRYAKEPDVTLYDLPINYRSVPEICALGTALVAGQEWNLGGTIQPASGGLPSADGYKDAIQIRSFGSQAEEAQWIVQEAAKLCAGEQPGEAPSWRRVAVLCRLSQFLSLVEIECVRNKIPYDKRAGGGFTTAKEVEDILAYLRVAAGYDVEGKWEKRIINVPFRYIGKEALARAEQARNPLGLLAGLLQDPYLYQKQRRSLYELQEAIESIRRELRKAQASCGALVRQIIQVIDYERHLREQTGSLTADESKLGTLEQLAWIGDSYMDVKAFLTHIDTLSGVVKQTRKNEKAKADQNKLVLSTIHRCVDPSTFVETSVGLLPISLVPGGKGIMGTAEGQREAACKISYSRQEDGLRITTKSGYEVIVTLDHGMMSWDGQEYRPKLAAHLKKGDWLRLCLHATVDPTELAIMPGVPDDSYHNAKRWSFPARCTAEVAELLGLLVADGTVYKAGFRVVKADRDVVERAADLTRRLFNVSAQTGPRSTENSYYCEVNSTQISRWLIAIGGLAPNQKAVPMSILCSPLAVQAAFLRGLFEDGTVNVRGGMLDHVAWFNNGRELARTVQIMLLRFGIITRRFPSGKGWRVDASGTNGHRFGQWIGFISARKQAALMSAAIPSERMHSVPVSEAEAKELHTRYRRCNAKERGLLSRREAAEEPILVERLRFHHDRIKKLEPCKLQPMCFSIPTVGRFLQNGFDGCNSKGLEFDYVILCDVAAGRFPWNLAFSMDEELRLLYVAVTRARKRIIVTRSITAGKMESMHITRMKEVLRDLLEQAKDSGSLTKELQVKDTAG